MVGCAVAGVQFGAPHDFDAVIADAVHGVSTDRGIVAGEADLMSEAVLHLVKRFQNSNHMGPSEFPHFAVRSPRTATDQNHGIGRLVLLALLAPWCRAAIGRRRSVMYSWAVARNPEMIWVFRRSLVHTISSREDVTGPRMGTLTTRASASNSSSKNTPSPSLRRPRLSPPLDCRSQRLGSPACPLYRSAALPPTGLTILARGTQRLHA